MLVLLVGIFLLAFFVFQPFLYSLILAVVFATVFKPLHKKILAFTNYRSGFAALLSAVCVLVITVTPLAFLGTQIFQEATQLYVSFAKNGATTDFSYAIHNALASLEKVVPLPITLSDNFNEYAERGLNWLLQHLDSVFSNIAKVFAGIFVFLIALYYVFKDGEKLKNALTALSPLQDTHDKTIFNKLEEAVNSVVKGNLTIALIQGAATSIGFFLFGIPSATLWGAVAAIAALVPGIGTTIVLAPAILYLFISGKTFFGIGLLLWGIIAVGLVDNLLGPKLVERGTRLHSFLVLLSILGGISFWGPLGFLLGPLTLSLLFALLEIYFTIQKEHAGQ